MITIRHMYERFEFDRSSYCAPATLKKYQEDLKIFFAFLKESYGLDIMLHDFSVLPEDASPFAEFIIFQRSRNLRAVSIRSYCRSIKAFLRFCYEEDYCKDYLKRVKQPRDDSVPKLPLTSQEVARLDALFDRSSVKGARNYCMVHLMLDCGLRRQEVIHLKPEHLVRERNVLTVVNSKGDKSRFVLIPDFLLDAIQDYLVLSGNANGYVFCGLRSSEPVTNETIKQLFADLKKESGISRLHAHLLRHTFATSYLVGGGNLEFLRVFMGHYDYCVTKKYSSLAAQIKMLGYDVYRLDDIFFTRGY